MNKSKFYPLVIAIVLLSGLYVSSAGNRSFSDNIDGPTIEITIHTAYYADLEGDGLENDVFVGVILDFIGANSYNLEYYIELILPSGLSFLYAYNIYSHIDIGVLVNYFWNHALESGDYTVKITISSIIYSVPIIFLCQI